MYTVRLAHLAAVGVCAMDVTFDFEEKNLKV